MNLNSDIQMIEMNGEILNGLFNNFNQIAKKEIGQFSFLYGKIINISKQHY